MRRPARSIVFLSLGFVAACGGGDPTSNNTTPDAPQISSVSPDPMIEGQVAILTGTNFSPDMASNTVTMNSVTLVVTQASATSLTVTIPSGCGPLRSTDLRVTTSGVFGDVFGATVAPDPAGDAIQNVELAVGEQIVYRQPRHCLGLPTNGGAAQYLIGVQSTGLNGGVTRDVTVEGTITGAAPVPSAPVAAVKASPGAGRRSNPLSSGLGERAGTRLLQRHRARHNAVMDGLVGPVRNLGVRPAPPSSRQAPSRTIVPETTMVGDLVDLRYRKLGEDCTLASTETVTARLRVKTSKSMWFVDVADTPDGFTDADLQMMGDFFDDVIWASSIAEFDYVNDIDGNGRVVMLITQRINAETVSAGQLLGFVNPCDFFPRTEVAASNEGEFFYAIAPDPAGAVGDTLSVALLLELVPTIIAHEFTHIIQFSRREASTTALDFMAQFVAEGQATLGEEVIGHLVLGNDTGLNLGGEVAFDLDDVQVFPWYFASFGDLVSYFGWPGSPDLPRTEGTPQECTWIDGEVVHPCEGRPLWYGVTWSFLRWASDVYGDVLGGEPAFQAALIDGDLSGFANLEAALAGQGTLEDHLARWAATLYMDDRPGASPEKLHVQLELARRQCGHHGYGVVEPRSARVRRFHRDGDRPRPFDSVFPRRWVRCFFYLQTPGGYTVRQRPRLGCSGLVGANSVTTLGGPRTSGTPRWGCAGLAAWVEHRAPGPLVPIPNGRAAGLSRRAIVAQNLEYSVPSVGGPNRENIGFRAQDVAGPTVFVPLGCRRITHLTARRVGGVPIRRNARQGVERSDAEIENPSLSRVVGPPIREDREPSKRQVPSERVRGLDHRGAGEVEERGLVAPPVHGDDHRSNEPLSNLLRIHGGHRIESQRCGAPKARRHEYHGHDHQEPDDRDRRPGGTKRRPDPALAIDGVVVSGHVGSFHWSSREVYSNGVVCPGYEGEACHSM